VECHLVLKGREPKTPAGNFFLSRLFGAKTRFISEKEYEANVDGIMHAMARRLNTRGKKAYVIPEGGSDPLGVWGYIKALQEIKAQAETANLDFDTIVTAVGSGGTFAGLYLGSKITGWNVKIMGFAVCRNTLHFQRRIFDLCLTVEKELGADLGLDPADIDIDDCFIGPGYARIGRTEADFIRDIAIHSGLVLDPAYTSKALLGLFTRIAERRFPPGSQVLFIHTGGIFGLLPMGKIATSE
jgi:D-cysteine desulfhydrase